MISAHFWLEMNSNIRPLNGTDENLHWIVVRSIFFSIDRTEEQSTTEVLPKSELEKCVDTF